MTKVPCKQCGAQITDVTAQMNDGICMFCKGNAIVCSQCGKRTLSGFRHSSGTLCLRCFGQMEKKRDKPTSFDLTRLLDASVQAISNFAASHSDEEFYALAIDANILCLNSTQSFAATLQKYRTKHPKHYSTPEAVQDLKMNTGDWAYQGFFDLDEGSGFCHDLYDEHYDANAETSTTTEYSRTMAELLKRIQNSGVLLRMKTTDDFVAIVVEHNY
jgi:hypothetical protein